MDTVREYTNRCFQYVVSAYPRTDAAIACAKEAFDACTQIHEHYGAAAAGANARASNFGGAALQFDGREWQDSYPVRVVAFAKLTAHAESHKVGFNRNHNARRGGGIFLRRR